MIGLRLVVAALLVLVSGCALASKGDALEIRYYTPEASPARAARLTSGAPGPALRLGRVTSGAELRERMVRRLASGEVVFDEAHRWTERPEVFVRRAVERELFEERGYARELVGSAPTLDLEVLAFEERAVDRTARVAVRVVLHDGARVRVEETLVVDRPLAGGRGVARFVRAANEALGGAVQAIADRVAAALPGEPRGRTGAEER